MNLRSPSRTLATAALVLSGWMTAAWAADPAPAASAPAQRTDSNLPVRPSRPIELTPEGSGVPWSFKVLLIAAILGGGGWYYLKQVRPKQLAAGRARPTTLRIAARTAIGVRSELIVVDVEGQSLLIGVTPQTITRLAVLPQTEGQALAEAGQGHGTEDDPEMEVGFRQALARAERSPQSPTTSAERPARASSPPPDTVEEQARGLLRPGKRG